MVQWGHENKDTVRKLYILYIVSCLRMPLGPSSSMYKITVWVYYDTVNRGSGLSIQLITANIWPSSVSESPDTNKARNKIKSLFRLHAAWGSPFCKLSLNCHLLLLNLKAVSPYIILE